MNKMKIRTPQMLILGFCWVGTLALAQSKTREPSAACKFDIKSMVIRSESSIGEEVDEKNLKLLKVFPEIKDFSEGIPVTVAVAIEYSMQGCKDVLATRMTMTPGPLSGEKKQPKAWVKRDVKLEKLPAVGEFVIEGIPLIRFFEVLTPETVPGTVTFDVVVLEDGRDVAVKSVTIDSSPQGD